MGQKSAGVRQMKLGTAKVLSMASLLLGLAVGLLGHFLLEEGTSSYLLAEILTALLFIAGLLIVVVWCRCPHCGRRLFYKMFQLKVCPGCKRRLDDKGRYVSGKR